MTARPWFEPASTGHYYSDAESVTAWKRHPEHQKAQRLGRERWYDSYTVQVARVERSYTFRRA